MSLNLCNCPNCQTDNCPAARELERELAEANRAARLASDLDETMKSLRYTQDELDQAEAKIKSITNDYLESSRAQTARYEMQLAEANALLTQYGHEREHNACEALAYKQERDEALGLLASEKLTRNSIIAKGVELERQLAEALTLAEARRDAMSRMHDDMEKQAARANRNAADRGIVYVPRIANTDHDGRQGVTP